MYLVDYKDAIAIIATVITIIQFLSGYDICRKIIKQGSTGETSGLPFIVGCFSTSLWLVYSVILQDLPMGITNTVGLLLQVFYFTIYLKYCTGVTFRVVKKQTVFFSILIVIIFLYIIFSEEKKTITRNVGFMCCAASVTFSMSPLSQLREVFRTKSTALLPLPLITSMFFVGLFWFLYGLTIDNPFVTVPNFLVFCIAGFQLSLFLIFSRKPKETQKLIVSY